MKSLLAVAGLVLLTATAAAQTTLTDAQSHQLHQDICTVPVVRAADQPDAPWGCAKPRDYPGQRDGECMLRFRVFDATPLFRGDVEPQVYLGRFTAPVPQALIGYVADCEPHASNWGGVALFRIVDTRFELMRYFPGALTDCVVAEPPSSALDTPYCLTSYIGQGELVERFGPVRFTRDGELKLETWLTAGNFDGYLTEMVECGKPEPGLHHLVELDRDPDRNLLVVEAARLDPTSFRAACDRFGRGEYNAQEREWRATSPIAAEHGFVRSDENKYVRVVVRFQPGNPTPRIEVTSEPVPQN